MRKRILFSLLALLCVGWASAQSALTDKRVEKFRVSVAELPALLEDLELDPSLAETVVTTGDVEVMRITEKRSQRPNAFFFDLDDQHDFNGIFDELEIEMEDFDFNILELEKSTERLGQDMERLAEELELNGDRIQKRIKMRIQNDGNEDLIEWNGKGDMPEELIERLEDIGEDLEDLDFNIAVEVEEDIDPWIMRGVEPKPLLGVYHETHEAGGVLVTGIVDNSGAESAGLQDGDRITAFDGQAVDNAEALRAYIKSKEVGDDISIRYIRDAKTQTVNATLGTNKQEYENQRDQWKHHNFPHRMHSRPMLGVNLNHDNSAGFKIEEVHVGSNAARMGMQAGDILLKMNGVDIQHMSNLTEQKKLLKDGDKVSVTVNRDGSEVRLSGTWEAAEPQQDVLKKSRTFFFEPAPKDKEIIIIRPIDQLPAADRNIGFTNINVFPNPSSGNINVAFKGEDTPATIRISDLTGKVIHEQDVNPVNGEIKENIVLENPISGTLFVSVIQGSEIHTQRMVNN